MKTKEFLWIDMQHLSGKIVDLTQQSLFFFH